MLKVCLSKLPEELAEAARETLPMMDMEEGTGGVVIAAEQAEGLHMYFAEDGTLVIGHSKLNEFFRGVGYIRYVLKTKTEVKETLNADCLSYLLADGTNMVTTKKLIRYLALMGYNCFNLSIPPQVEKHPFMTHQAWRFTKDELKELIAYGKRFGVSVMLFLPTLAHMESILRWPCYGPLKDTADALYVGKEEVYEFLDDIFAAAAECLDDDYRRVHLGMDEAYNLGLGARLYDKGFEKKSDLMAEHLRRVVDICKKYNIEPIIYGDMFIRPFNHGGIFSDTVEIPQEVFDNVPDGVMIQFWHYYNCYGSDWYKRIFDHLFEQHMRFARKNPVGYLASNWKCTGFVPANDYAMQACDYQAKKCMELGVRDVTISAWPDDGSEASNMAIFPSTFLFAERFYGCFGEIDQRFEDLFCMNFADYMSMEDINRVPGCPDYNAHGIMSWPKIMLYDDPMCGLYDKHIDVSCKQYFEELAPKLEHCKENPHFGYIFETVQAMCEVLKNKATMSIEMREAYLAGDRETLEAWIGKMDVIIADIRKFADCFSTQWMKEHQYWGLERMDTRFGGLIQRMYTTQKLLRAYLDGELDRLDAFEEPVLYADCREVIPGWKPSEVELGLAYYSECTPWR